MTIFFFRECIIRQLLDYWIIITVIFVNNNNNNDVIIIIIIIENNMNNANSVVNAKLQNTLKK